MFLVSLSSTAGAATYVVPDDDQLIAQAEVIVSGRVVKADVRPTRGIETWSSIEVDEVFKGGAPFAPGYVFEIPEAGGIIGDTALVVPGSPQYRGGDKVVAFLARRDDGQLATLHMGLGKFRSEERGGRRLLVRGEDGEPIVGMTPDGREYLDPQRDEEGFRGYIREKVKGKNPYKTYQQHAARVRTPVAQVASLALIPVLPQVMTAYPASAYMMTVSGRPARWRTWETAGATVSYRTSGTQRNQPDSVGSAMRGLAAWTNDTTSGINLVYAGTTTATRGTVADKIHSIIFNDPSGEVSGSWSGSGVVAVGRFWATLTAHTWKNESFYGITEGDVIVQDGVVLSSVKFDEAMVHELGHTLGFRHSNGGTPSTSAAIMNSSLSGRYGVNLQSWDRSAAASAYAGSTSTTCTAVNITAQPQSTSVASGGSVTLAVTATGTTPKYQWYRGATGVTTSPVSGATARTYTTPALTSSTSYWVKVSNTCSTKNSAAAAVNVCTVRPSIVTAPLSQTIAKGTSATLSVTASGVGPFVYEWYQGAVGDTTRRVGSAQTYRTPLLTVSTSYWVRVRNACGYKSSERAALITVR